MRVWVRQGATGGLRGNTSLSISEHLWLLLLREAGLRLLLVRGIVWVSLILLVLRVPRVRTIGCICTGAVGAGNWWSAETSLIVLSAVIGCKRRRNAVCTRNCTESCARGWGLRNRCIMGVAAEMRKD